MALVGPRRMHGEQSSNRIGDLEESGWSGRWSGCLQGAGIITVGMGIGWSYFGFDCSMGHLVDNGCIIRDGST